MDLSTLELKKIVHTLNDSSHNKNARWVLKAANHLVPRAFLYSRVVGWMQPYIHIRCPSINSFFMWRGIQSNFGSKMEPSMVPTPAKTLRIIGGYGPAYPRNLFCDSHAVAFQPQPVSECPGTGDANAGIRVESKQSSSWVRV